MQKSCLFSSTFNVKMATQKFTNFDVFLKILFYLFLERWEGREKERESNINVCLPLVYPLLGNWPATMHVP